MFTINTSQHLDLPSTPVPTDYNGWITLSNQLKHMVSSSLSTLLTTGVTTVESQLTLLLSVETVRLGTRTLGHRLSTRLTSKLLLAGTSAHLLSSPGNWPTSQDALAVTGKWLLNHPILPGTKLI